MKVVNETWRTLQSAPGRPVKVVNACGQPKLVSYGNIGGPDSMSAARLAAKAPEMARMLLALAGQDGDPYCQGCGHLQRVGQHTKDCDLWRVLAEAGVVEGASVLSLVSA